MTHIQMSSKVCTCFFSKMVYGHCNWYEHVKLHTAAIYTTAQAWPALGSGWALAGVFTPAIWTRLE